MQRIIIKSVYSRVLFAHNMILWSRPFDSFHTIELRAIAAKAMREVFVRGEERVKLRVFSEINCINTAQEFLMRV